MTVAIYVRVSTEEQAKEGYSIAAQKEKLKAYCHVQDWDDYKFYIDEGISAKDTNRPQLQLMLQHIEEGLIKTVLVYRLDRLTRSVLDLYKLLDVFEEYNCSFKSATELYDTNSAIGRLFITLVAAMAEWERNNLGERVRMGQIEKARQGEYAAKAPLGFDKVDSKLVVNEQEKEIVLLMRKKLKEGYSIRRIADYLDNSGIQPIRGYKWHIRTILDVLHNPALYGAVKWRDEIIEGAHEGIVTKEEFNEIEKLLKERQNIKKRETYSVFIYQMKLVCPNCGSRLTSERSKYFRKKDNAIVENNHYRCQVCAINKRPSVMVSEKRMEKAFLEYMKDIVLDVKPQQPKDNSKDKRNKLMNQLVKIEKQREKYQRAWSNDLITDEEFKARMQETKEVMDGIKDEIDTIPMGIAYDEGKISKSISDFNVIWNHLNAVEKKEFMSEFIESIEFKKKGVNAEILDISFY